MSVENILDCFLVDSCCNIRLVDIKLKAVNTKNRWLS